MNKSSFGFYRSGTSTGMTGDAFSRNLNSANGLRSAMSRSNRLAFINQANVKDE
jgi:hypothetical protein